MDEEATFSSNISTSILEQFDSNISTCYNLNVADYIFQERPQWYFQLHLIF